MLTRYPCYHGIAISGFADMLGMELADYAAQAGLADLETVDGISTAVARVIYDHFHDAE